MKFRHLFLFAFFLMPFVSYSESLPPIEPGVSKQLAEWRAAHYSDIKYKLNITLEKMAPLMKGDIEIFVTLDEEGAKNDLVLDWRTTAFQNDKDKPYANIVAVNEAMDIRTQEANEHIRIPSSYLKRGENKIKIQFASPIKTSGSAITRYIDKEDGSEYIYSLFVPSDASTAFPCFDQPDLKGKFRLRANVPPNWKVISNSAEEDYHDIFQIEEKGNYKTVNETFHFEQTKPISSYVFAFAAGNFTELMGDNSVLEKRYGDKDVSLEDRVMPLSRASYTNIYLRKSQVVKFEPHAKEVFRLNRESVKFFEEYFDYKFPFPKYDLVLIPEFPFGGMEHAGATFLRESSIIFPSEPTKNDNISRANLIFHEAAHQWFGDTVTMKWFDDLWLKEGFATFAGYKAMEKIMPEYNAWKVFYERTKQAAYQTDSTKGTTPIYQEIPNLSAAKSAYGNIVYNKAPAFLRQAEFYLGEREFQTAVRNFLKKHEFRNATWQDLVKEFELAKGTGLDLWGQKWIRYRGMPFVFTSRNEEKNGINYGYSVSQMNALAGERGTWYLSYNLLEVFNDGTRNTQRVDLFDAPEKMPAKTVTPVTEIMTRPGITISVTRSHESRKTLFLFPNYQDYGYGLFLLDPKSRDYILKNIQNEKDDFLRAMMWGSLWDSVREAELDPKEYVELAIKNISVESDVSTIQTILGRVSTAMNYYLSENDVNVFAPRLEKLLLENMKNSSEVGQRITYYRAFLSSARSPEARQGLKNILNGERFKVGNSQSPALPELRTKDKFDIVTRLAILGDSDAAKLLEELKTKETSDNAKRYAYSVGAGFGTKEAKEKYFNDFVSNKEISESWIEAAFVPFNSVRHSELTLPYLQKALEELPNHKRNRKIFFVNGWLGAFIGGQRSEEALKIVNKFLADNPNLDKDLRLKILENVDVIERAVKIRQKFGAN